MTTKELLAQLEIVKQDRLVGAHHDDIFFTTYPDMEAIDKVIGLIKFLDGKKLSDKVTVAELWNAAGQLEIE